jgi:endonuclease G
LYTKKYSGFEVTLLCDKVAQAGYTVGYSYSLTKDQNDFGTKRDYRNDPSVPDECQQQFRGSKLPSYKTEECTNGGGSRQKNPYCYDRGHIVTGNHMDGTSQTKTDASYVTNLVPQATGLNQGGGSWYVTEKIIECHRDFDDVERLDIFGGLLYDDEGNDYFLESHGIPTPDLYYKVVAKYFKDGTTPDVIAWVMKNEFDSRAFKLDQKYNDGGNLIEVKQLKRLVDDSLSQLPSMFTERAFKIGSSWDLLKPEECKKGNSNTEFSRSEL